MKTILSRWAQTAYTRRTGLLLGLLWGALNLSPLHASFHSERNILLERFDDRMRRANEKYAQETELARSKLRQAMERAKSAAIGTNQLKEALAINTLLTRLNEGTLDPVNASEDVPGLKDEISGWQTELSQAAKTKKLVEDLHLHSITSEMQRLGLAAMQAGRAEEAAAWQTEIDSLPARMRTSPPLLPSTFPSPTPVPVQPTYSSRETPAANGRAEQALVIVGTSLGTGSGFLAKMGDDVFVVTNQHVVEGSTVIQLQTLAGQRLTPRSLEVAQNEDLIRFKVDPAELPAQAVPLSVAHEMPRINTRVTVYGNSDGAGVATRLTGALLGVGPGIIEVSASFVSGNSGSPILNERNEALGVATYVTNTSNEDWIKRGTRFADVRRFGYRLTDQITWVPVHPALYVKLGCQLRDMEYFFEDMIKAVRSLKYTRYKAAPRGYQYQFDSRGNLELDRTGAIGTDGLSQTYLEGGYDEAAALARYQDDEWPKLIAGFYSRYGVNAQNSNQRMNKSTVERNDQAIQLALDGAFTKAGNSLKSTRWPSRFQYDQATGMAEFAHILSAHVDKLFEDKKTENQ